MIDTLQQFLNLIENDIDQRREQIIAYSAITVAILASIGTLPLYILGNNTNAQIIIYFALLFYAMSFWLNRQQQVTIAKFLVPFCALFSVTGLVALSDYGVLDVYLYAYISIIFGGGLLLGMAGTLIFTLLSVFAIWGLFYLQNQGHIADPALSAISMVDMAILTVQIMTTAAISVIIIRNLSRTLQRIRAQEQAVWQSNQDLQQVRLLLEETIQERTRRAKQAQAKAETAQEEMAQQAWFIIGQSHLADVMRGEQSIPELATNAIRQICFYLGIPMGALFVMKEDTLVFVSGHRFIEEDMNRQFGLGEGLVGEAAKQQRPLRLDLTHEPYLITSGRRKTSIEQILVYPFLHDGVVMGVLELGHKTAFTEQQLTFLDSIVESLGIAFHTAYTRSQIKTLLQESL